VLLDFGIGENDDMADSLVRDVAKREIDKLENRGYADNGIAAFKESAANFMRKVFSVTLDSEKEVNHAIGSKPALAMLPAAFINPGDITLMTVPGYPVAGTHTKYYGGKVHDLPLREENGCYPDLDGLPAEVRRMSKGFNMIGWRMAFVAGHPKIVQAFADVKDNSDSGQFMAIQQAAKAALEHPELGDRIRDKYQRRLKKLVAALTKVGFQAKMPG